MKRNIYSFGRDDSQIYVDMDKVSFFVYNKERKDCYKLFFVVEGYQQETQMDKVALDKFIELFEKREG